jgi:hypothetical protein
LYIFIGFQAMASSLDLKEQIEQIIPLYSTNALTMFHDSIRKGLAHEESLSDQENRLYGYREHSDFWWQADAIELELAMRNQEFEKIDW